MSASLILQRRLVAALSGMAGVTGVFDGPPVDAAPPYLVIGPDTLGDWGTKTETGHEHRIIVTLWDNAPGAARARGLMGEIEARLAALAGPGGGIAIVSSRLVRALVLTDAEGWRQGITEFRIRTQSL